MTCSTPILFILKHFKNVMLVKWNRVLVPRRNTLMSTTQAQWPTLMVSCSRPENTVKTCCRYTIKVRIAFHFVAEIVPIPLSHPLDAKLKVHLTCSSHAPVVDQNMPMIQEQLLLLSHWTVLSKHDLHDRAHCSSSLYGWMARFNFSTQ